MSNVRPIREDPAPFVASVMDAQALPHFSPPPEMVQAWSRRSADAEAQREADAIQAYLDSLDRRK